MIIAQFLYYVIPLSFDQSLFVADFIKDQKEYMSEEELENFNGRAYSFGYTSNDIVEVEFRYAL